MIQPSIRLYGQRSIFGLSTLNGISSIMLLESEFLSKDQPLSYRDSILAWIVREQLFNPGLEKLLPLVSLKTLDGPIMLSDLINSLINAES
jgi:hypothetical protein